MASGWIAGMLSNGIQTAIQPGVASAGSFAGGAVSSIGNGVNSVGESINSYVRRYGTGIQDYGNAIRDWSAAEGPRAQTASNPLGLSSTSAGGKLGVTNPRLPTAIPRSSSTPAAPQRKKIEAAKKKPETQKRAQAPVSGAAKPSTSVPPKTLSGSGGAGKVPGKNAAKATNANKVKISPSSKPQNLNKAKTSPSAKPAGASAGTGKPGASKPKAVNHLYVGE